MNKLVVRPSSKYVWKLRLILVLIVLAILFVGLFIAVMMSLDGNIQGALLLFFIILLLNGLWWVPGMLLTGPYYRSLSYEIQADEVIVNVGIFTKTVKHVPYRTVTNIEINRGLLDRWVFGIGTLKIQTAGMSGQSGVEEELVGMENVNDIYEIVVKELRRFRGGMTPTMAEEELTISSEPIYALNEILEELRAIRGAIDSTA